jgi:protein-S-isoprenylcysteine O-methyltransferase Ste14
MDARSNHSESWMLRLPAVSIDRSSWVSWATFVIGAEMARGAGFGAELKTGGPGLLIVAGSIAVFFVLVLLIQRHMRLSLLANTFGEPQQLVTSGVFRYSRNPIYVAFLIPLASLSYYSTTAAMAAVGLYMLSMTYFVIAREERVLEQLFGETYLDYKKTTPRWLFAI